MRRCSGSYKRWASVVRRILPQARLLISHGAEPCAADTDERQPIMSVPADSAQHFSSQWEAPGRLRSRPLYCRSCRPSRRRYALLSQHPSQPAPKLARMRAYCVWALLEAGAADGLNEPDRFGMTAAAAAPTPELAALLSAPRREGRKTRRPEGLHAGRLRTQTR